SQSSLRLRQIAFVDFKADEFFHTAALRRDGGISDPEKRIEDGFDPRDAVQFDAPFCQLDRKGRGMWSLLCPALNCFVWNKPGITAATQIASARMPPPRDVAFVLIRNADREPI